jgi:hypothetical protein
MATAAIAKRPLGVEMRLRHELGEADVVDVDVDGLGLAFSARGLVEK